MDDLLLTFLPACGAGSFEEFRASADDVSVNDVTLFFRTDKDRNSVVVVATCNALVCG